MTNPDLTTKIHKVKVIPTTTRNKWVEQRQKKFMQNCINNLLELIANNHRNGEIKSISFGKKEILELTQSNV